MRGLKQDYSARIVIAGHAFVQNVRRGHYELAAEEPVNRRVAVAFDELAWRPEFGRSPGSACLGPPQRNTALSGAAVAEWWSRRR
jgi:hypothetical protein